MGKHDGMITMMKNMKRQTGERGGTLCSLAGEKGDKKNKRRNTCRGSIVVAMK
jgi:hypothetical protein